MNYKQEILDYVMQLDEKRDNGFLRKLYTLIRRYIIRGG